jgi:hypothetical protein
VGGKIGFRWDIGKVCHTVRVWVVQKGCRWDMKGGVGTRRVGMVYGVWVVQKEFKWDM